MKRPATHELKTDPDTFDAVWRGDKTHEIRLNDRAFMVGDSLHLKETVYTGAAMREGAPLAYTGRELTRTVSHILTGYGLMPGWCILSLEQSVPRQLVQMLTKQCADLRDATGRLGSENEKMRQDIALRALHQANDVWIWQGDGNDHPESFSNSMCIVIRGDQLRALTVPGEKPL